MTAFATPSSVQAHVVPPEEFHPVAESYRRLIFLVNLNPVPWDLVASDVGVISTHLAGIDPAATNKFRTSVEGDLTVLAGRGEAGPPDSRESRAAARRVFTHTTRATAATLLAYLESSKAQLEDHRRARTAADAARQIWAGFEHEVRRSDPSGFMEVGGAWLELTSALGSPGFLDYGSAPPVREEFDAAVGTIRSYILANFGPDYEPDIEGPLLPLPVWSPTYDTEAVIPPKLPPGSNLNKQLPRPRQILNMAERGVDEGDTTLIALGDMAFDSPYIFGDPARSLQISCNTCHNKSITNPGFVVPGLSARAGGVDVSNSFFAPHANNGHADSLDIPDLRGIRFTAPYGRNGRFSSLAEFVRNVIVNEFNGPEPDPTLMDGMIAYMNEFDFLPNPNLQSDGWLVASASAQARRGEEIFHRPFDGMGGKSCASCHIPESNFLDHRRHDIGSVMGSGPHSRDGALDTPTLLSAKYSAPYFHDGSQPTLHDVTQWFNDRFSLGLSDREQHDLTAYVETVSDGIEAYEDTMHTLEAEMEEFSFFLSTFEYLRKIGKGHLNAMTFQTIALEIHAHKWDIQAAAYLPVLNHMAALMEQAVDAQISGDSGAVESLVAEYRQAYEKNADSLK